jgi:hypothetical protein
MLLNCLPSYHSRFQYWDIKIMLLNCLASYQSRFQYWDIKIMLLNCLPSYQSRFQYRDIKIMLLNCPPSYQSRFQYWDIKIMLMSCPPYQATFPLQEWWPYKRGITNYCSIVSFPHVNSRFATGLWFFLSSLVSFFNKSYCPVWYVDQQS